MRVCVCMCWCVRVGMCVCVCVCSLGALASLLFYCLAGEPIGFISSFPSDTMA